MALKKLLFLCIALLSLGTLIASHNRAGEITYKRIAPFVSGSGTNTVAVYNYSITVIKYFDDGPGIADRCVDTVYFGDGGKGIAARINGSLTGCCTIGTNSIPCGEIIINLPGYRVKKSIYSITHTFAGPGNYIIRSEDINRQAGLVNVPNSLNLPFYLESLLIINAFSSGSSPVMNNPPLELGKTAFCLYHQPGAVDTDGDSLSYDLSLSKGFGGTIIPGASYPNAGQGGYFFIHPTTGLLHWCSPQSVGTYNFGIIIKKWRKNQSSVSQLVGYVHREMEVKVDYGSVGLDNLNSELEPLAYPNPFADNLHVRLPDSCGDAGVLSIFTLSGNLVTRQELTPGIQHHSLFAGKLISGIYLMVVECDHGVWCKKVVRE